MLQHENAISQAYSTETMTDHYLCGSVVGSAQAIKKGMNLCQEHH